jgi:amino acid transporter
LFLFFFFFGLAFLISQVLAGAAGLHFVFVGFDAVVELGTEARHFRRCVSTATSTLFTAGLTILFVCAAVFTLSVPVASLPAAGPLLGLFSPASNDNHNVIVSHQHQRYRRTQTSSQNPRR